jgi:hypothetical protein
LPNKKSGGDVLNDMIVLTTSPDENGELRRKIPATVPVDVAIRQEIWSVVSNALKTAETKNRSESIIQGEDGEDRDLLTDATTSYWAPNGDRLSADQVEKARARCDAFIEFARTDAFVYEVLVLIRDESISKPAEIAERFKVPVEEVYAAKKRTETLMRKFKKLAESRQ